MATSVFFSFHYKRDIIRVQKVANIGALDGQALDRQEWEKVKEGGEANIEKYIDEQMAYKRAVVVLIGTETSKRPWVKYEIRKAWNGKKPLVGIRINGLEDFNKVRDPEGANPFTQFKLDGSDSTIADYVPVFTPTGSTSQDVYNNIAANLDSWVDQAYKRS